MLDDLYDILDRCDDAELAPIVELLVASPASVFGLVRAFELHQPEHSRYADRIADEIYRLALEAIAPKERTRPAYDVMVAALCAKVGIAAQTTDVSRNERFLFDVLAPRHLETVSDVERAAVISKMIDGVSKAVSGMFASPAWPPFAAVLLHVALLRRGLQGGGLAIVSQYTNSLDDPSVGEGEGTLVMRDEEGTPVLTLASLSPKDGEWRELASDSRLAGVLIPLLRSIEPLVSANRMLAGGKYVRVGLRGGAAALSHSKAGGHLVGSAIGHKGQVPLFAVAAGGVAWPAAVLVLASTYMEQRRFENIERSLEGIRTALDDVSRFQRDERRAIMTGSISYFQQVSRAVLAGELDQEVLQEIEGREAELVNLQDHVFHEIDHELAAIRALKKEGWTSSKFVKSLGERQSALERFVEEAALCISARSCGYQLLCAFPGRDARKRSRFDDIGAALDKLCPDGDLGSVMDQLLREKLVGISSVETRATFLGSEGLLFERLQSFRRQASGAMSEARRFGEGLPANLSFDVRIENGAPVAISAT